MTYEIEDGIPAPTNNKYRLDEMEVGQSILYPREDTFRVRAGFDRLNKQLGYKYKSRITSHGLRVWRVA